MSVIEISALEIRDKLAEMCGKACYYLPPSVRAALEQALGREESPVGRQVLTQLITNADLAAQEKMALCQDCGLAVVFLDIGQDVHIVDGDLTTAVNQGVAKGYAEYYLRKSTCHPFTRANQGDNTPAIIYTRIVPGSKLHILLLPKGGGADNMSTVTLLTPAVGWEGIKQTVLHTVDQAGSNACPPLVAGVAVGGTFDEAAVRAKRILARPLDQINPDPELADKENELLSAINQLGHGPAGLGGRVTCLRVFLDAAPCHIGCLPLAVNLQCHSCRHEEAWL